MICVSLAGALTLDECLAALVALPFAGSGWT